MGHDETSRKVPFFPAKVHGEWGKWSPWTSECYCEGRQFRHRLCDSPEPQFDGNTCPGKDISYRSCTNATNDCKVYDEPKKQSVCEDNLSDYDGFNSWSGWSSCSSECGHGLSSRKRVCKLSGPTEGIRPCTDDVVESRPCRGNGNCLGK
ncbi:A disintegrin and metalloproteinase with thrombospondin motifs adt-1-like [Mercenaria mercenaria]|uniref:A disintegrin and metalloproteinase with thrombospondin motifs adt-1-like n=1 Tax=Mercenaria mercenaria TaxID=6596 RepID=UPI00234F2897|nr:A disintegrin and metalloproteinase with thrombospondin motifs adt-1-like [Mercenaria mercenaria]